MKLRTKCFYMIIDYNKIYSLRQLKSEMKEFLTFRIICSQALVNELAKFKSIESPILTRKLLIERINKGLIK